MWKVSCKGKTTPTFWSSCCTCTSSSERKTCDAQHNHLLLIVNFKHMKTFLHKSCQNINVIVSFFLDREICYRKWRVLAWQHTLLGRKNSIIYTTVHQRGRKWFRFNLSKQNTNTRGICVYAMLSPDLQTNLHVEGALECLSFSRMRFRSTENLEPGMARMWGLEHKWGEQKIQSLWTEHTGRLALVLNCQLNEIAVFWSVW